MQKNISQNLISIHVKKNSKQGIEENFFNKPLENHQEVILAMIATFGIRLLRFGSWLHHIQTV